MGRLPGLRSDHRLVVELVLDLAKLLDKISKILKSLTRLGHLIKDAGHPGGLAAKPEIPRNAQQAVPGSSSRVQVVLMGKRGRSDFSGARDLANVALTLIIF